MSYYMKCRPYYLLPRLIFLNPNDEGEGDGDVGDVEYTLGIVGGRRKAAKQPKRIKKYRSVQILTGHGQSTHYTTPNNRSRGMRTYQRQRFSDERSHRGFPSLPVRSALNLDNILRYRY